MSNKPQLSEEQRQQLRALVTAQTRDLIGRGDELKEQAATMRQLWQALVAAPTWNILTVEKPEDTPTEEIWSMTPTVTKL